MKPLAVVHSYAELIAALRDRCDELGVPMETIDAVAGIAERHTSKILAAKPLRHLGPVSWNIIETMGLTVVLVEDAAALAKAKRHPGWSLRKPGSRMLNAVRQRPIVIQLSRNFFRKMGLKSGAARMAKMRPSRRRAVARNAARVRWQKRRKTGGLHG